MKLYLVMSLKHLVWMIKILSYQSTIHTKKETRVGCCLAERRLKKSFRKALELMGSDSSVKSTCKLVCQMQEISLTKN